MKRLLRWSFHALSLLSLLICMATCAVWVRSYLVGDQWVWYDTDCSECANALTVGRGFLRYSWWDTSRYSGINPRAGHYENRSPQKGIYPIARSTDKHSAFAGFRYERAPADFLIIQTHLVAPFVLSVALPLLWLLRARRERRRSRVGLCHVCGYDLRASGYRCPECGTARAVRSGCRDMA